MRRNLVLPSLFLLAGFLVTSVPSFAQVLFDYGTQGATVLRQEDETALVGTVSFVATDTGSVPALSAINMIFNTTVSTATVTVTCVTGGSTSTDCSGDISTSATGTTLTLEFTTSITFEQGTTTTPAGSISVSGIRVDAAALSASALVTANVNATSPMVTFNTTSQTIGQVSSTTSITETLTSTASELTCVPAASTFSITITENFDNALRDLSDEEPGATSGDELLVSVTNVPAGVTLTPQTPTTSSTLTLSVPGAQTNTGSTQTTLVFCYLVTAESTGAIETATLPIEVTATTIAPNEMTPSVASVVLGPTTPSTSIPLFSGVVEPSPQNVVTYSDCVTDLMFPYVTNFQASGSSFDTGIAVANTTLDTFASTGGGAVAQSGTCTFTLFPNNGGASVAYTSPSVAAGGTLAFDQSTVAGWAGLTGYILATCNFQNAHGFVFITDNFGVDNAVTQGYLALIIPNPSVAGNSRNAAPNGTGSGEALNN